MRRLENVFSYIFLSAAGLFSVLPILWLISTALKSNKLMFKVPPVWIPDSITFEHFRRIWTTYPFDQYIINTSFVTGAILIGQLVFCSLAAYSFARLKFPGRDAIFVVFLGSLMIPEIVVMIPQYIMMNQLDWINTYKAMIAPQFFGNAFAVFLLRQHFITLPRELEDAAKIDGAGILGTFVRIILPMSKPALATLTVYTFVKNWNNFLWPLIVTNSSEKYVLSIGLANLNGQHTADWGGIMSASLIALLPMLIVFSFAQKYFVESIQMSGLK
jgi:multiple sugar transport system permease protein